MGLLLLVCGSVSCSSSQQDSADESCTVLFVLFAALNKQACKSRRCAGVISTKLRHIFGNEVNWSMGTAPHSTCVGSWELDEQRQDRLVAVEEKVWKEYCAQMVTFRTIGEFVEGHEDWMEYEERLERFFSANDICDGASTLLSACGAKTYKLGTF